VQYIDPIRTYIVDTYGVALRFEERSVDDESRVTRWIDPIAPGLRTAKEKPAIHTGDFRTTLHKPPEREIATEKISYRCVHSCVCACACACVCTYSVREGVLLYRQPVLWNDSPSKL
jgi:hypothetical protein